MAEIRQVKTRNFIAYALGELYGGGSFIIISLLFIFFLTDIVGLSPFLAGLVVLIGKGWDAISDPIMGYLSDITKSRYGRRRVYFLIGVVPVALSFVILWIEIKFQSQFATFLYYAFAYSIFATVFTMVMIPYRALNAEMSPDYAVRTRLTGAKMIVSQVSALLAGTLPKLIVDKMYAGDPEKGFLVMGAVFGILYAVPWIIVYMGTWEVPIPDEEKTEKSFMKNVRSLFLNRSFRIHMGLYISAYSAMDILMAMFVYYLTYYINKSSLFPVCLGSLFIASMLMLPVNVFISNKKGQGFAYMMGLMIWISAMALTTLLTPETPVYLLILNVILMGVGMSAGAFVPWAILPSIIDVDELINGRQRAGFCSGAMTLLRKLIQAFVLFVFGGILDLIGYVPNVAQSAHTLTWMRILFFLAPGVLILLGLYFGSRFRITPATHSVLKSELERLRSGGSGKDASPKAREVCELLSGIEYARLYPANKQ